MCDFHPISLADKTLFDELLPYEDSKSSGYSFGNVYLWDLLCRRNVARMDDRLCVEYLCKSGPFFAFPVGRGELAPVLEALRRRAEEQGRPFLFHGVTAPQRQALEEACPGRFAFSPDREDFDYIYTVEALSTLSGKKLHGKRNHCNKFEVTYPDWHYERLSPALFDGCLAVLDEWDAEKDGGNPEENRAIRHVFRDWDTLGMEGGILYAGRQVAAFSIGERLTADTMDVHFEKARDDVEGAYPMITWEFSRQLAADHPELRYLNREEDMGIENMQKAKESWYPLFLVEKYTALWGGEA